MAVEVTPPTYEIKLADAPEKITCFYCREHVETEVEYQIGSQSIIMSCITMPCLVCWVPLVMNRFKDTKHSCPNCKEHLGMFVRF